MDPLEPAPLVSAVMINWNRKEVLKQALTNVCAQSYPNYEILLCDNGSTDGAPDMVEKEFPQVKLMRLKENVGIKGYNIAFERSAGEIIVILDNDSYLEKDGFAKIVRKFRDYPQLGALGCKVFNHYSGKVHHWHPTVRELDGPPEGFDAPLFNGCAGAARRSVLKEVGFYPEEFFLYENERDLCTRIINAGYDVKYFTDIAGFHMVSEEGRTKARLVFYSTRNVIWYYWKYLPLPIAVWRTMLMIGYRTAQAVKHLAPRVYLSPVWAALAGLPAILKRRRVVKEQYLRKIL